jgi:methyl-accepting chemotaxis protein
VKRLADDVSVASRQQAAGIEQVSKAIIELEKSTQAIAGTAEEGAAASEELNAHSDTVIGVVGQLEILVGSSSNDGDAATPGSDAMPRPAANGYRRASVGAYTSFGGSRHERTGTFG